MTNEVRNPGQEAVWRARWTVALATTLPQPALMAVLLSLAVTPRWVGSAFALLAWGRIVVRVRRRSLTVTEQGFVVQRDKYRVAADWDDVVEVRRRRLQRILLVDELVLSDSQTQARRPGSAVPTKVMEKGAAGRVQISIYDKNWRAGPVGAALRVRGVIS